MPKDEDKRAAETAEARKVLDKELLIAQIEGHLQATKQIEYEKALDQLRKQNFVEMGKPQKSEAQAKVTTVSRKDLADAYLAAFQEKIVIQDICWAAKQRYREWKRWIGGTSSVPVQREMESGRSPLV